MDAVETGEKLLIVDRATGKVVGECQGAGPLGVCPQAPEGGAVPCAGRRIMPAASGELEGWTVDVYTDAADGCPLAVLPVRHPQES